MQTAYRELKIWQQAFALTLKFYGVIARLPECESRNIADQMRRAATSLPLNIAEGAGSQTTKMFLSHLKYAYASSQEIEVLLMLCFRLKYINDDMFNPLYEELDRFKCATYKFTVNLERKEGQRKLGFLQENTA